MIHKAYLYGDSAGEEQITDMHDFALNHIQDEMVAISEAERMLIEGEVRNEDLAEGIVEVYTLTDRDALAEALQQFKVEIGYE